MTPAVLFAIAAIVAVFQSAVPPLPGPGRYLVTERAIDVGNGIRLCIAIDIGDSRGVWWWGPGESDCATRTTGPNVFTPEAAAVSPTRDGGHTVRFKLGLISREPTSLDVRLLVESGTLRLEGASDKVPLTPRSNLKIPPRWPGMDGPP